MIARSHLGLDEIPDRPVSEHLNDVTEAGLTQIETALATASYAYTGAQTSGDRAALTDRLGTYATGPHDVRPRMLSRRRRTAG